MIKFSSEDIANQSFQTKFRGYDPDQVHEFLDGLARQWREVQSEFRRLQAKADEQERELREFRRREKSLVQALETARQVAEEIRHQADRDADLVLADTELKAERMLARAEQKVSELRGEMFELQQQRARFHSEMRQMVKSYESLLDRHEERVEEVQAHPLPPVPGSSPVAEIDADEEMIVDEQPAATT